jgi:hypothetical protein
VCLAKEMIGHLVHHLVLMTEVIMQNPVGLTDLAAVVEGYRLAVFLQNCCNENLTSSLQLLIVDHIIVF